MRFFRIQLWMMILLCFLWFLPLGFCDLIRPDEGRYAEIAREMASTGDWITPRLNGIKYFEKPPLQYWVTAALFHFFEPSVWLARLWPALTGFAGVLINIWFGKKVISKSAGYLAALVQASMIWYVGCSEFNVLDMSLCFFLQCTLLGYALYFYKPKDKTCVALIGVGIAGAFLSKGLIAIVLPGLVFVMDSLWHRDTYFWKVRTQKNIWLIASLLSVPWCTAVALKNPEFLHFFFIHEHFERFTTSTHHREGPLYYFIPILLIGLLPWTGVWLKSLKDWPVLIKHKVQHWSLTHLEDQTDAYIEHSTKAKHIRFQRLLMVWSVSIFVFFSISHSKLPSYILPIYPSLAWLLTFSLLRHPAKYWFNAIGASLIFWLSTWIVLLCASGFVPLQWINDFSEYRPFAFAFVGLMVTGCVYLMWKIGKEAFEEGVSPMRKMIWIVPVIVWSIGIQVIFQGRQVFSPQLSIYSLVNQIVNEHGAFKKDIPFYSVNIYDQTLDFYIQRTTTLVNVLDEMEMGCKQETFLCISSTQLWKNKWFKERTNAYAILPLSFYKGIYQEIPMSVLGKNDQYIIVKRY